MTIFGHQSQIKFLNNLVDSGKLPHAFLFWGPERVGKKTVALGLTKKILCPRATFLGDNCQACRSIENLLHPDLFVLAGTQEIYISQIRRALRFFSLRPALGLKKIAILDNAHLMNVEAANAFLKTLEEPSPSALLILITHKPHQILKTVTSRLYPLEFNLLDKKSMLNFAQSLKLKSGSLMTQQARGRPGQLKKFKESPEYFKEYLALKEKFIKFISQKNDFSWEKLESYHSFSLAEKIDVFLEALAEDPPSEIEGGSRWLQAAKSLLLRRWALEHFNINERLAWESFLVEI